MHLNAGDDLYGLFYSPLRPDPRNHATHALREVKGMPDDLRMVWALPEGQLAACQGRAFTGVP
jgi:hypothetical protein